MDNQSLSLYDSDEIDLRIYVKALITNWMWIILPAIILAVGVFFLLSSRPPTYQATALISVSSPSIDVVFDSRIVTNENGPVSIQNNDLPNLALSDAVIFDLYEEIKEQLPSEIISFSALRGRLGADSETRSEIVTLNGTFSDPELSAIVVNSWSEIFIREANTFFEGEVDSSQIFLQTQLEAAGLERTRVNDDWATFQAENKIEILTSKLESMKNLQQSFINRSNSLLILEYDIQGINNQLKSDPNNENILSELTLYALQNRAFNTGGNLQIELTSFENFSETEFTDRVTQLDALGDAIEDQKIELESRISNIEPQILELQQDIAELSSRRADLEAERTIILNTYDTLARKVAEGEIEQNDTTGKAQIVSRAIAPVDPEARGTLATSLLSAIVVATMAILIILAQTWWKEEDSDGAKSSKTLSSAPVTD